MTDYDNTNSGALFKNDKEGNENRPDYKGNINVNGTDFWISAWIKTSKAGNKYMSLSVQPKEQQSPSQSYQEPAPQGSGDFSDVPFMRLKHEYCY